VKKQTRRKGNSKKTICHRML